MEETPKKTRKKPGPKPKNQVKINDFKSENLRDDPNLPQKSLFRIDEVAQYFDVTERCIRLWIEHKHLKSERIRGVVRVPRESILDCRFKKSS